MFSHSPDGRLGADRFEIAARLPFSIDPKTPFEISNNDKVGLVEFTDRVDLSVIEALARLQLSARRLGLSIRLRDAQDGLWELLDLVGLRVEMGGEPECGEEVGESSFSQSFRKIKMRADVFQR